MGQKTKQIFILDDDTITSEVFKNYLSKQIPERLKDTVTVISTFENPDGNFFKKIETTKPDVLLLDYHLPTVGGKEVQGSKVMSQVNKLSPGTEVIMLTGEDNIDIAVNLLKSGAYDYIVKGETASMKTLRSILNVFLLKDERSVKSRHKMIITLLAIGWGVIIATGIIYYLMTKGNT